MKVQLLTSDPQTWAVVFDEGDEVVEGLSRFAQQHEVDTASLTAIGGFRSATLAYFEVEAREYRDIPVDEQVEVLIMAGNIARKDDGHQMHAHVVVGRPDGTTRGGHLKRAVVRPTLEVVVTETADHLRRRYDERTGLALIDLPPA